MKFEELEKPLNVTAVITKLCLQVGIAIGVLIVVVYCGVIGYYPTGVTLGDGFLFIAACLAFSFSYSLVVIALFSAGITLTPIIRIIQSACLYVYNRARRFADKEIVSYRINFPKLGGDKFGIVLFGLIVLSFVLYMFLKNIEVAYGLLFSSIVMGFIYGLWNTDPKAGKLDGKTDKKIKASLVLVAFLVPLIVSKSQGNILNQAMTLIGIRTQSAEVFVSGKYTKFLKANDVKSAKTLDNGAIYSATVLFNGIGTNTVIKTGEMTLIIPSKEIIIGMEKR